MTPPSSRFSRLSLQSMSPETLSHNRAQSLAQNSEQPYHDESSSSESESDSNSSEFEDDNSECDEKEPSTVRSPTQLTYLIDHLPETTQSIIRGTFREPPRIALEKCRRIDNTYAFQMTEIVTRSVRIRAPENGTPNMSCSCRNDGQPCRHILWLLDQIVKETLYDQDISKPLKMNSAGYAEAIGDPFQNISEHHLDVLAEGLHSHLVTPDSEYDNEPDTFRAQEAREVLSSVYNMDPKEFRPDIFDRVSLGKNIVKRHDLEQTIFRMLLDNHHFFHYFRSLTRSQDLIKDPFYKLAQRIDRILRDLDNETPSPDVESPRDVPWAASHILGCVRRMRHEIYTREKPLSSHEAISAARSLVHVLSSVVSHNKDKGSESVARIDRNLYLRLIGDRDHDFVLSVLNLIPEAATVQDNAEEVENVEHRFWVETLCSGTNGGEKDKEDQIRTVASSMFLKASFNQS
ncbi:swim zinc finger family [Fusarium longipes]|uniref:Swim zinc finger family n=1 Tax=Fusarium longipes TaxID=694270 RepID=A0A395S4V5_9HYPO|nr:swim zinc finger family [Fusarium longipes]